MICEKCNNDYPSTYYFATPTICKSCYEKLPEEEKQSLSKLVQVYSNEQTIQFRATFGKRLLAALVDTLILVVIILAVYKISGFFDSQMEYFQSLKEYATDPEALKEYQEQYLRSNRIYFAFPAILNLIYFLSEAFYGVSLGKYLLGLKIAKFNTEPAEKKQLWIRYLVKNSANIMMLFWTVTLFSFFNILNTILGLAVFFGFLLILGSNRQNLQDIIAKTAVFKTDVLDELTNFKNVSQTNIGI